MSVCWSVVCDESQEKLWCGQGCRLYSDDPDVMDDLSAFLYNSRGKTIRVVTDIECDKSQSYSEVGRSERNWIVWAHGSNGALSYLGLYAGSRRQALVDAAELHFPNETYDEDTNVLTGPWSLEAR